MLAAVAARQGHQVQIYSPDFEMSRGGMPESVITEYDKVAERNATVKSRLEEIVESFKPDLAGISLWTARAGFGLELAGHIESLGLDIPVVAGGVHATILPEKVLNQNKAVDFVIRGEGEFAFAALLDSIETRKDPREAEISGLSFRRADRIIHYPVKYHDHLDDLPFPGYEYMLNYGRLSKNAFRSVMSSRGCPFRCNYCASSLLWSRQVRYHSPAYIVSMVKHLHQKFGTDHFRFDDDTFTINKQRVMEICGRLGQERLPITWQCDTRGELVTRELLGTMKKAGCVHIAMGVESADPVMRERIKKEASLEKVRAAFEMAADLGIDTTGYFMLGLPGETYSQASRTLDFAETVQPTNPCIGVFIPYPGTEAYQLAVEMGVMDDLDSLDFSTFYHHSNHNFSGGISEPEWFALLDRAGRIQRKAEKKKAGLFNLKTVFRPLFPPPLLKGE